MEPSLQVKVLYVEDLHLQFGCKHHSFESFYIHIVPSIEKFLPQFHICRRLTNCKIHKFSFDIFLAAPYTVVGTH